MFKERTEADEKHSSNQPLAICHLPAWYKSLFLIGASHGGGIDALRLWFSLFGQAIPIKKVWRSLMIEKDISFGDLVARLARLNKAPEDTAPNDFIRVALTGQERGSGALEDSTQWHVLFEDHYPTDEEAMRIAQVRDYDSLIGFSSNLPYCIALDLHLNPQPALQLKSTLHVPINTELLQPITVC